MAFSGGLVCWFYKEMDWFELEARASEICESRFQRGDAQYFNIFFDGQQSSVSLEDMSMRRASKLIPLRREAFGLTSEGIWEYEEEASWRPYQAEASLHLEAALTAGFRKTAIVAGFFRYSVDLTQLFQRNMKTGCKRKIRRRILRSLSSSHGGDSNECQSFDCTAEAQRLHLSCTICMEAFDTEKAISFKACSSQTTALTHAFHAKCIYTWLKKGGGRCPMCRESLAIMTGTQPTNGTMTDDLLSSPLPGFPPDTMTRRITYYFPSGIQGPEHPNPGVPYSGTSRIAYLPTTPFGDKAFRLLKIAFARRLIFRVGTSISTGIDNSVIWAGIHHKTSQSSGPFGWPDSNYLTILFDELRSNGITED